MAVADPPVVEVFLGSFRQPRVPEFLAPPPAPFLGQERAGPPGAGPSTPFVARSFSQAGASEPVTRTRRHADRSTNPRPCSSAWISRSPTFMPAYGGHGRSPDPGGDERLPAPGGRRAAICLQ